MQNNTENTSSEDIFSRKRAASSITVLSSIIEPIDKINLSHNRSKSATQPLVFLDDISSTDSRKSHLNTSIDKKIDKKIDLSNRRFSELQTVNNKHNILYTSIDTINLYKDLNAISRVNQYMFLDNIGVGSSGYVKRVLNIDNNKIYALKIISKNMLVRKYRKNKYSNLQADNIDDKLSTIQTIYQQISTQSFFIKLIEIINIPDSTNIYMIFDIYERGTIKNYMYTIHDRSLFEIKLHKYFKQLITAVEYLHINNIVHRDIKPDNILIDSDDNIRLGDFDIAVICSTFNSLNITIGTAAFFSPEICSVGIKNFLCKPTDIWAMGVTLYFLYTGYLPFSGSLLHLYGEIINKEPEYPSYMDINLVHLLKLMFIKNPDNRITITDMKKHPWVARSETNIKQPWYKRIMQRSFSK